MMDWQKASAELAKPLQRDTVKTRQQGGATVSYIEGWHAINEANRIFGFGAWTRELIDLKCVSERERSIGKTNPKQGFGVSYIAKVRITVDGVTREGVGAGHGIDVDCGQAHESAAKEAETDAMKRALVTFGNPFGLALYDKAKANVADEPEMDWHSEIRELVDLVTKCTAASELANLKASERFAHASKEAPEDGYATLAAAYKAKKAALAPKAA